jgi:hypothetical protein
MSGWLVGTNVLSERRDQKVLEWRQRHESRNCASAVCLGEISHGIALLAEGKRKRELTDWARGLVVRLGENILRFDTRVALHWGQLLAGLDRLRRKMPLRDSLIAVTALRHRLAIATRNVEDFRHTINPCE